MRNLAPPALSFKPVPKPSKTDPSRAAAAAAAAAAETEPERREFAKMNFVEQVEDEYGGRCRKHPWESRTGVCPICLKNRLILLCPHCANVRPCLCFTTTNTTPSSSTSTSSSSSSDLSVARISFLIDREPPFRRSRSSAAFHFARHRTASDPADHHPRRKEKRRWVSSLALLLSFLKAEKPPKKEVAAVEEEEKERKKTTAMGRRLMRSSSVGFPCYSGPEGIHGGDARLKGWGWIPSPIKVFRQPKPAKILQERSPLCRG